MELLREAVYELRREAEEASQTPYKDGYIDACDIFLELIEEYSS